MRMGQSGPERLEVCGLVFIALHVAIGRGGFGEKLIMTHLGGSWETWSLASLPQPLPQIRNISLATSRQSRMTPPNKLSRSIRSQAIKYQPLEITERQVLQFSILCPPSLFHCLLLFLPLSPSPSLPYYFFSKMSRLSFNHKLTTSQIWKALRDPII